ncbi:uroporphyrinogen-III C-methyltransferase [Pseudoxanthomonas sacheonensis]|uniref:uroporphyrinogen-III C-methyltransferase n=1 Tax=Pseudoxanthomonas sacheonensis TaxID=443615 RepID=UPI003CCDEC3B
MTEETISTAPKRGRIGSIALLLALLLLVLLGWRGWAMWQAREARAQASAAENEQRIGALEQRIDALRRDQRAQTQRILDAAATNRVLRDEVLGLSQRGALLEDSVSKLADPTRHGAQALRLDEVELLLSQAQQRLAIADDLDGARRAYALADGALRGIDDPRLLNLRQALAQERAALDTLGNGPHAAVARRLDAFAAGLEKLPDRAPAAQGQQAAWQRLLSPLVDVRRTESKTIIAPTERAAGQAALQIELSLARAALERDDAAGFRAAIVRMDQWLTRLWPDSPALRQRRDELKALRTAVLQPSLPVLGSTLQQLRQLRNSGHSLPLTQPVATPSPSTPKVER